MAETFNEFTNKQGLIVYGGESSADYGMVVSEAPAFERPTRKQTIVSVPGRNGAILFQEDAFEDVVRTYKVWMVKDDGKDLTDTIDGAMAWLYSLTGYQRLEDNFEPDVFRLAYFNGGANVSNELMQYGETTLSFTCRPERFYKDGEQEITLTDGVSINNPTRFASKPLLYVEGSGSITISISGTSIVVTEDGTGTYIDCETMNAYTSAGVNANTNISGDFPTVEPGINTIGITGTVTTCTIIPRYYTI